MACDRSVVSLAGCFPMSIIALPDITVRAALYFDRWNAQSDEVGHSFRRDLGILEQISLWSCLYDPGRLSWRDDVVHAINDWIMARLGRRKAGACPGPAN